LENSPDLRNSEVDGINAAEPVPATSAMSSYQALIIGSSLRSRKYNAAVIEFIKDKDDLNRKPAAFFSVSLGDSMNLGRKGVTKLLKDFLGKMDWQAVNIGRFGGALLYTKYDFWTKFFMGMMGYFMEYPTNTTKDHKPTDWRSLPRNL